MYVYLIDEMQMKSKLGSEKEDLRRHDNFKNIINFLKIPK